MPTHAESNACSACARSKRKCGRQVPSCARCVETGRSCVYPSSKSSAASSSRPLLSGALRESVSRVEDAVLAEVAGRISPGTANPLIEEDLMLDLAFPFMDGDFNILSSLIQTPSVPATRTDWFLAPETWKMSNRGDNLTVMAAGIATLKRYVAVLQSWFERWVTTGSNPLIHPWLYSASFPACAQVAYATLASYIHRTPANKDTVLQIVEDRSNHLLRENGAILDESVVPEKWADKEEQDIDLFIQLARLHALMVYQMIGLFDGDIRSRHVAEARLGIQEGWAGKLFHSAAKALSNTHAAATHLVDYLPTPSTYLQQQWYLWIMSESIRRIWLVAISLSRTFSALQRHWAACPGMVMYTNRSGLWDAVSASEWEKHCSRENVAKLQWYESASLFDNMEPADVDEFGMAMLDMTANGELLEKWRDRSGAL